jgi:riboflavin kinase/FMN adenylyltransferase
MTDRAAPPPTLRIGATEGEVADDFRNRVVAIGSFDGVHRGHRALLGEAIRAAEGLSTKPIALTFEPHPRTVLQPEAPFFRLTPPAAKRVLLGLAGAEGIVEIQFDHALAALSAEEFADRLLHQRLAIRGVVVGEGFRFGNRRTGDVALLEELGGRFGFSVTVTSLANTDDGERASSGRVRSALAEGAIAEANKVLGYRWFVTGTVTHGDGRGRELGYPTANVGLTSPIGLSHGIYAVSARTPGSPMRPGVASYGVRPMFNGDTAVLEVHLFDFAGDLYGSDIAVFFHAKLRNEEKFPSMAALIRQMDVDSANAKIILAEAGGGTSIDQALAIAMP